MEYVTPELEQQLKQLKLEDLDYNLEILSKIKEIILNKKLILQSNTTPVELAKYLYQGHIDENWTKAQCQSIINQIDKMINQEMEFLSWQVTREFILDISLFDNTTKAIQWETKISSQNYLSSMDFFLNAKFSYTDDYHPTPLNGRTFIFATTPTLIRQAIEIKIKNMVGIKSIYNITKERPAEIGISDLLRFFEKKPKFINLPIDITILRKINTWSNGFLHTGIIPYSWQSLEAIDLIEPMFSCKNEKMIHLEGFNYLNNQHSREKLKTELERFFSRNRDKIKFNLYEKSIEGAPN